MPTGEVYEKLNSLISQLSEKYNAPYFEPHITLISEILGLEKEIVSKTDQLASVVQPYRIEFSRVEYLDEYFKCLFIRVKETDAIMRANQKARKIFGRETDSQYIPHLSLVYGDFSPQTKKEIIREIGREFNLGFDVDRIHLFSTNGKPEVWHRVKEFPLIF